MSSSDISSSTESHGVIDTPSMEAQEQATPSAPICTHNQDSKQREAHSFPKSVSELPRLGEREGPVSLESKDCDALFAPTPADTQLTSVTQQTSHVGPSGTELTDPRDPFFQRALPGELRNTIYIQVLALLPGIRPPPILEATAKASRREIYSLYRTINFVVRLENYLEFRKLPWPKLKNIRHLYLVWEGDWTSTKWLSLQADKCKLKNDFKSLTFDFSAAANYLLHHPHSGLVTLTRDLITASREMVEKVTFIFSNDEAQQETGEEKSVLEMITKTFGFDPQVVLDTASGRQIRIIVWEGDAEKMKRAMKGLFRLR